MNLWFDSEAVAYLASGDVGRTLLFNRDFVGRDARDALTAAGHRIGELQIGFHWRIGAGVVFDGEAAGV